MSFCVSMPHFTDIGSLTAYPGVRDNRSTINTKTGYDDHGRDMTSYRLSRCGRCGSPILGYVWFCIWWCYSHQNPKSTKYYWHISIYGWDITTSGLETQMSATLELYFRFRFWLYHRNRHVILYQLCRLSSKLDTYCGNMTSYQFVKMAAVAAQYYFRFRICWCHCHQKSKIYQQTKFCHHISINGWDITTSGLEKQMSAILEFYFRFRSRPFCLNRRVILHQDAEFSPNRTSHLEIWRHIDFQDGGCQSCCIYIHLYSPKWCLLWGNGGPPTKCFSWSELALG